MIETVSPPIQLRLQLAFWIAVLVGACQSTPGNDEPNFQYPVASTGGQTDVYHGVRVADPYRWLEDESSPATEAFLQAQDSLIRAFLDARPERELVKRRLAQLRGYDLSRSPHRAGDRYFYFHQQGLQDQQALHVAHDLDGPGQPLVDPNLLSEDGTVALHYFEPSRDGRRVLYTLSEAGSDWREIRVRDVASGEELDDRIRGVHTFSRQAWAHDGSGFYYDRPPTPASVAGPDLARDHAAVFFHLLGDDQSRDRIVYERADEPDWWLSATPTTDGHYVVISAWEASRNAYFVIDLQGDGRVRPIIPEPDAATQFVGNDGRRLWFLTDRDAPRRRVVEVDAEAPGAWKDVISEGEHALQEVRVAGNHFVARYLRDGRTELRLFDLDGSDAGEIRLPAAGSAFDFTGREQDTEAFFTFASFATPETVYRYDFLSGDLTPWRAPRLAFDPEQFETIQVFYESKDGTRVPMFLSWRRDLEPTGPRPVLMYGYGGFGAALTPWFSGRHLVWMELGGVYAQPGIRGGSEYGSTWYADGVRRNKQNSFDDFIAAADWLIDNGYTEAGRIAISGVSNGGLLVAAVLVQRPDLFGAAVASLGLMDMLRYQELDFATEWVNDYGTIEDPEDFAAMLEYSPYHNVSPGTAYPAVLIITGKGDTRVSPAHSYKFAAALQAAQSSDAPILLRVEDDVGHGGLSTGRLIDEQADRLTFLMATFGLTVPPAWETSP